MSYRKMTSHQFAKLFSEKLDTYIRRVNKLKAVSRGDIGVAKTWVKPHTRPETKVTGHYRYVYQRNNK